jgi:hypothetical protein
MKLAIRLTLLAFSHPHLRAKGDGAALSIPANPVCYCACALIFHNPDQIKLCQDNCNISSEEASSFVASSSSEERTPLSCRDICNIFHGSIVAQERCYRENNCLEKDEDGLDTSVAFVGEAAAVGLRGAKPSEAQTDKNDGFHSDKAV